MLYKYNDKRLSPNEVSARHREEARLRALQVQKSRDRAFAAATGTVAVTRPASISAYPVNAGEDGEGSDALGALNPFDSSAASVASTREARSSSSSPSELDDQDLEQDEHVAAALRSAHEEANAAVH